MDSVDLIARENEFKKLNKQLERKTESLMKEIEEVMQKPDFFSTPNIKFTLSDTNASARKHRCNGSPLSTVDSLSRGNSADNKKTVEHRRNNQRNGKFIPNIVKETNSNKELDYSAVSMVNGDHSTQCDSNLDEAKQQVVCDCCIKERMSDELEFLYAFVSVSVKDNILPQSYLKGKVTVESVCKCLSAKVKLMQEQIDKLQGAIEKKNKQCEAHLTHMAELEGERLSLLNAANSMRSETADMKAKYLAIQNRLNEKERLYMEQRSATDKLSVEIKQYKSKNSGLEARCATQEEALASLRQQLEAAKLSEKEYRDSTRALSSAHAGTVGRLEAQAGALRLRVRRLRALADNLRAQRTLLAAGRAAHSLSAQYCQLLEDE